MVMVTVTNCTAGCATFQVQADLQIFKYSNIQMFKYSGCAAFQVQADLQNPGKESSWEALRGQQVGIIIFLIILIMIKL